MGTKKLLGLQVNGMGHTRKRINQGKINQRSKRKGEVYFQGFSGEVNKMMGKPTKFMLCYIAGSIIGLGARACTNISQKAARNDYAPSEVIREDYNKDGRTDLLIRSANGFHEEIFYDFEGEYKTTRQIEETMRERAAERAANYVEKARGNG
ncbi:MAG: hypothetical protein KJ718_01560 [Nanoarchaeota archaeon]|nr:hypothetical protein [Nanoarchaeota archaeon]